MKITHKPTSSLPLHSGRDQTTQEKRTPNTTFGKTFNQLLGFHAPKEMVSEEDLFATAVGQQLKDQFGAGAFNDFKTALKVGLQGAAPNHSGPSAEYAGRQALNFMVASGSITKEQAQSIRGNAFQAAQIDSNLGKLYDSVGGPGDDTKAVERFSKVQDILTQNLATLAAGGTLHYRRR